MARATQQDTVKGGRRPAKLCSVCHERVPEEYIWWLEDTGVAFICKDCQQRRAARSLPVEETRVVVDEAPPISVVIDGP